MFTPEQITSLEKIMIKSEKLLELRINILIKDAQVNGNTKRVEAFLRAMNKLGMEQY